MTNKVGERKGASFLNPLAATSAGGERFSIKGVRCNKDDHLLHCLHLCDQKEPSVIRGQIPANWGTGSFLPTLAPKSCVQVALGTCA